MNTLEMQDYALKHMTGNLYWKGLDGRYFGCNEVFAKISGFSSSSDIIGKSDRDLFIDKLGEVGIAKLVEIDNSVLQQGLEKTLEEIGVNEKGEIAYYLTRKSPIKDSSGEIVGLIGSSIDITKEREAETLQIDFIRKMEHDIRTPFCGIAGITETLLRRETDPEKKSLLNDVALSAKELLDYCNQLLYFSRSQASDDAEKNRAFNVRKLIKSVMAMELPAAKLKKIDLIAQCGSSIPKILVGDSLQIRQMLINLVSNAIKFTETGYVKIDVQLYSPQEKESDLKKCRLMFCVEDTGIGVSKEKQKMITKKFVTLHQSNRGMYKGVGLGLPIVKKIIQNLDGELFIESQPGKGSVFKCMIPLKHQKMQALEPCNMDVI